MLTEQDIVQLAALALEQRGHSVTRHETRLEHRGTKFIFRPRLSELHQLKDGGFHSVTTITTIHPEFAPNGIFEFQHATGDNATAAICRGFEEWAQLDLAVLIDAELDKPKRCTAFEMTFPPRDGAAPLNRRAMLGPVKHFVKALPGTPAVDRTSEEQDHPFCPCCLLTNTFKGFLPFIEADGFFGIQMVAVRDESGSPQADCRVNGQDWEAGKQALREYVDRWPQAGYELRKQYVVLQNIPNRQDAG
jgi:hypothetical protein